MKKTPPSGVGAEKALSASAKNVSPVATTGKTGTVTKQAQTQIDQFDAAMKLFHSRDFAAALKLFEQASKGSNREISHAAKQHWNMCNKRLEKFEPELQTPEDSYHYAIGLIGSRKLTEAEQVLKKALELKPSGDLMLYALALCKGLQGDYSSSAKHLEQAIRIDPRNRNAARTDPDFQELVRQQPIRDVLFAEKKEME